MRVAFSFTVLLLRPFGCATMQMCPVAAYKSSVMLYVYVSCRLSQLLAGQERLEKRMNMLEATKLADVM